MIIRDLTTDNDWKFGQGKTNFLADDNAITLNIKTRINEWYGDCFFAARNGIDWKNRLDKGQQQQLDLDIQAIIAQSFGVIEILSFSSIVSPARKYTATFNIKTIFSESIQSGVNI